ncbi:MAG: carboxymuconolactone decarboxylase family protein [Candidatus Eisenbacteria bacterium]|nr:carboxymuconolactone decarboxylase family protein [Candidatus Eisenbacteria bacterium]
MAAALRFAVVASGRDARAARRAVIAGRRAGVPRRTLEEIALMLMLYAGYPAALEALRALAEAWPPVAARGRRRARRTREGGPSRWRTRGEALCRRVYGPRFGRLIASVRALHPDLAVWMVEHGYGRVLARPGPAARARALVTVAVLGATGRERQLVSHLIGARRLGASAAEARAAWRAGMRGGDAAARAAARRAWGAAAAVR